MPFVKPGKQKQLFFLNFNIDGKKLSGNDRVRMLKKSKNIAIRKWDRKAFINMEECLKT